MTNSPIQTQVPVPVDAEVVPVPPVTPAPEISARPARKWWQVWKPREKKPKRALLLRLFGIGIWGTIKLIFLCIVVGFLLLTMQFDPTSPDFNAMDTLVTFFTNALTTAKWAAINFWKPALTGGLLVLPIWILWRLITLPFRQ